MAASVVGSLCRARGAAPGVRSSLEGRPQAVVVHGEAGVGKTTLVRSVVEELRADGVQVLWGQGLRFGAVEAMYHPLVLALEGWLAEGDDERRTVARRGRSVRRADPAVHRRGPGAGRLGLVTVVDALVEPGGRRTGRACSWSTTCTGRTRRPGTPSPTWWPASRVNRWPWSPPTGTTACRGRVPSLAGQPAPPARHPGTGTWSGSTSRAPPTRSRGCSGDRRRRGSWSRSTTGHSGNPYFSELLVRRGDLGSAELPADLPDELSEALLDAWRGLSLHGPRAHPHPGRRRPPDRARRAGLAGRRVSASPTPVRSAKPSTRVWSVLGAGGGVVPSPAARRRPPGLVPSR